MSRGILPPMRAIGWVRAAMIAVVAPGMATLLALPLEESRESATSLYLLAVVVAAAAGGLWGGLGASLLAFLGLNYFFTPPRHTFRVSKTEDLVALLVFLVVAAIVAMLMARALTERDRAAQREREANLLNYFAAKLLSPEPLERRLRDLTLAMLQPFELVRCEIHAAVAGEPVDVEGARPGPDGPRLELPISAGERSLGTLVATRSAEAGEPSDAERSLFTSCTRQLAIALERAELDRAIEEHRVTSETNQLRAALFSSVTHDLRTPLASIKASVTSLLGDGILDPAQQRELLETVLEETDRLNRLVGNIVDLARMRAGALVPARERTAIEDVVESVLHRMQRTLAAVVVRTVIRPDVPDVMLDPVQIDQVLTNVLENAVRFSPPGGEVLVSVAAWRDGVQVRVGDQGPGVPAEDRERVFEPFYQRDTASGRGGSGLGLAISRAIVLAHGGRIRIEGSPSGGTAVVFELPRDGAPVSREASG
ncbi:MAG TPA: ATP-binding protein [Actinomycetota bacterium]|nr:ATP-binding protein [Actinomycetota bacterium]